MKVQCVICDRIESIDENSPLAKRLKNRPIHTYMCQECYERIKEKTEERLASGKFKLYSANQPEDDWW